MDMKNKEWKKPRKVAPARCVIASFGLFTVEHRFDITSLKFSLVTRKDKYTVNIGFFFLVDVYVGYFCVNGCSYTQTGKSVFLAFFPFIFSLLIVILHGLVLLM